MIIFSWLANKIRLDKLSRVDQFVMAYGGLRGAIAFSLVVLLDSEMFQEKRLFITTTVVVVYFTVFIQVSLWVGSRGGSLRDILWWSYSIKFISLRLVAYWVSYKSLLVY